VKAFSSEYDRSPRVSHLTTEVQRRAKNVFRKTGLA
jgi:hypothetical protein